MHKRLRTDHLKIGYKESTVYDSIPDSNDKLMIESILRKPQLLANSDDGVCIVPVPDSC